ncbi:MAG TPA: hypothetical protein VF692_12215 [Pyrinomonadaceae bacterium]|jgi:hypothetical protein
MKLKPLRFLIIVIFFSVGLTFAQNAADAAKDVKFQVSFAGGKTVYRIGEPIKLILSYTAAEPGYVVESYYSPRFDDVIVTPTDGVYDWLYRLNRLYSYDDVSAPQPLSASAVNLEITVNDLVRFDKPGKYKIKVVSRRAWAAQKEAFFRRNPIALSSNEIELEIKEMSEIEERTAVKRLMSLMDAAPTLPQHQIYKCELDYLTGDFSTAEKVNRFLNPPVFGGVRWLDTGKGLDIARNKELAIKLLETALRDPNREVNDDLIRKLVTLRLLMEDERQPSRAADSQQLWKERGARSAELSGAYYAELLDSLPKRAGRSQIFAAFRIFTSLPKTDVSSVAYTTTKTLLLEKFGELEHSGQSHLLEHFWDKIKTPALIPALEKILANEEPLPHWSNRANAFKRLIELDQNRARLFVINEIRDPDSLMNPDFLKDLNDEFLPETDDALLAQITKLAATEDRRMQLNLQFKLTLAARYATAKIYAELADIYKKHGSRWRFEQSAPLLSYLARHNDRETMPLIEEQLNKSGDPSGSNIFYSLTKTGFTKGMEKLLQKRLESDEPQTVGSAAYYLSKYGGKENKSLIEKRYNRWLEKWIERRAELENPDAGAAIKSESMFQINLLEALIRAEKWKLPETEISRLKLTCLTENCRRHFSLR